MEGRARTRTTTERSSYGGLAALIALAIVLGVPATAVGETTLEPVGEYSQSVHVTSDPDDPERLFVVERAGRIQLTTPEGTSEFVDLTPAVTASGGEQGLLSVAFPPDHAETGLLYVFYTGSGGALTIAELASDGDAADPGSLRVLLTIPHSPFSNHNGGQLQFGPDGYLYISTGDGGGGGDPEDNGQDPTTLLGTILRIDPRPSEGEPYTIPDSNPYAGTENDPVPGARDEIWSWGLRNPWRFSFDRETGALAIGDVGQGAREEIDYRPQEVGGGAGDNFGWDCREGSIAYGSPSPACAETGPDFTEPVFDYPRAGGCSITGGYVVRDPSLTDLYGRYLYADYCVGELRSIELGLPLASDDRSEGLSVDNPTSFGEDACGRLYVAAGGGTVSRLVGDTEPECDEGSEDEWTPVFVDEFEGLAGWLPSTDNWRFSIGHGYPGGPDSWGTGEIAYHTDDPANVRLDGTGNLRITPLRDEEGDWTSARIETNRQDFRPPEGGAMRIEARIQIPDVTGDAALGYWPAFWALGSPYRESFNWPEVGEVDIMENVNGDERVWGVLHCGTSPGGPCNEGEGLASTITCSDDPCPGSFHDYRFEWDASTTPNELRWYLDGTQYHQVSEGDLPADTWEDMATHDGFFLILNVAIGGGFPDGVSGLDTPTEDTEPGHPMRVDRVAVSYQGEPENTPPAIDAIAADPDEGEAPLEVSFTSAASDADGDELSYEWDFGDGGSSGEQNPTHTYEAPGTYEAEVTVSDGEAEVSDSVTVEVNEPPNTPPVIDDVSADPDEGEAPLEVDFAAEASDADGDELTYEWDFADGGSSSQQNPTYTYTEPGTYEAEVTVSDGTDEVSDSVEVEVESGADETPPETIHRLIPLEPGDGGTYDGPVTVVLTASDEEDGVFPQRALRGSGVATTEYRVNGGAWELYDPFIPLRFTADGDYTVDYFSTDNAGNVEEPKSVEFSIDTTGAGAPELNATGVPSIRRVGPNRKQVIYRLRVRNTGDADAGRLRVCARGPRARVRVRGRICRVIGAGLAQGARYVERYQLRIRRRARGKLTRIRMTASSPAARAQRSMVRLRVR